MRFVIVLWIWFLSLQASLVSLKAFAQRGTGESQRQNRNSQFATVPGFFDSYTPKKGGFAADLFGALDYGVTETTTFGLNAYSLLSLISQNPHLFLKVRSLLFSDGLFDSAFTLYANTPLGSPNVRLASYTASSMNSFFFGAMQAIHVGAGFTSSELQSSSETKIDFSKVALRTTFLSAQYEVWPWDWFNLSVLATAPIFPSIVSESVSSIQKLDLSASPSGLTFLRVNPSFVGENWSLSVPFFTLLSSSQPVPGMFLNVAYTTN